MLGTIKVHFYPNSSKWRSNGVVTRSICLFVCLFVCLSINILKAIHQIKFILLFKVGSNPDPGC